MELLIEPECALTDDVTQHVQRVHLKESFHRGTVYREHIRVAVSDGTRTPASHAAATTATAAKTDAALPAPGSVRRCHQEGQ